MAISKSTQAAYQEFADMQSALEAKRQETIEQLLTKRVELDGLLQALGYEGTPSANAPPVLAAAELGTRRPYGSKTAKGKGSTKKTGSVRVDRYCPYCDMIGMHDGRAHKSQKKKKAFTQSELDQLAASKF